MLKRQTTGSVVCPTCGRLVGVLEPRCFNCKRWNPGLWGYGPMLSRLGQDLGFTQLVIGVCGTLYLISVLSAADQIGMRSGFELVAPSDSALLRLGMSGAAPVFVMGRWWTVLSAAWLHGGLLHIFFNLMWVLQLAPITAKLYGSGRLVIIYFAGSLGGFGLTSCIAYVTGGALGAVYTVGASAPLFGLFGALWLYGRRTGQRHITQQITQWLIFLVIFGLLVARVDNFAHLGGFLGGYGAARWLDPLREEHQHHYIGALICLILMLSSIALSILIPIPMHLFL